MASADELLSKFSLGNVDRLASKQMSIRPTLRVAAKTNAMVRFFKEMSKTDMINELLLTAITNIENAMDENTRKSFEEVYKECLIEILNRPEEKVKK